MKKILKRIAVIFVFSVIGALIVRAAISTDKTVFDDFKITDESKVAYADGEKLTAELDRMTDDLKAVAERINAASEEESKKVFCLIFAEAKAKEDSEYQKELDKLNASVKRNVRVALIGAGLLAFISAVLLIIEAIL